MIAFGWVTNMLQRGHGVLEADAGSDGDGTGHWRHPRADLSGPPTGGAESPALLSSIRGEIEFRDLTFAYGPTTVLSHVSVHINAGETVALVGPTGSGKSTLISLLARLHDPPPGTVFVDGLDVRDAAARYPSRRDRVRAAGAVSVLRHAGRQRRVRPRRAVRRPTASIRLPRRPGTTGS